MQRVLPVKIAYSDVLGQRLPRSGIKSRCQAPAKFLSAWNFRKSLRRIDRLHTLSVLTTLGNPAARDYGFPVEWQKSAIFPPGAP